MQEHEVVPGLVVHCGNHGVLIQSSAGNPLAMIQAVLVLNDRDAVLRLASILAEAAEAMPVVEVSNG